MIKYIWFLILNGLMFISSFFKKKSSYEISFIEKYVYYFKNVKKILFPREVTLDPDDCLVLVLDAIEDYGNFFSKVQYRVV